MTKELSERRKADRAVMTAGIVQLVTQCGASCEVNPDDSFPGPFETKIVITTPRGLNVTLDFNGQSSQPNVYVLSWHMGSGFKEKLNNATFGGNVNQHHFCKATYVARGYADLCRQLRKGLTMAVDGSAFLEPIASKLLTQCETV